MSKLLINKAIANKDLSYAVYGHASGLTVAIEQGSINMIKLFLEKGAEINGDNDVKFPLNTAVNKGNLKIVEFLVSKGANVNTRPGYEPLSLAVIGNNLEIAEFLISKGANVTKEVYKDAKEFGDKSMKALIKGKY